MKTMWNNSSARNSAARLAGILEFVFAANGVEALAKLREHPDTDMVFSDINMPQMDGLTLLGKNRRVQPAAQNRDHFDLQRHGQHPPRHEPRGL